MTIERTSTQAVPKPWGSTDLRPWSSHDGGGMPIGEIWFQRSDAPLPDTALLLKLLFTTEPLSIQVHPDDAFAHSVGLAHGKSEAWYVLSAKPGARIALGLKQSMSKAQLRSSIDEGSLSDMVQWRAVSPKDVIFVSAGMIHAIGPGLVVLEVQQRSDVTYRLFDHGRPRALQVENAIAAASSEQVATQAPRRRLTSARELLLVTPRFVLEHFELPPTSNWEVLAAQETWAFMLDGRARFGSIEIGTGDVIFLEADRTRIEVGSAGLKGIMAYVGCEPNPALLRGLDGAGAGMQRDHEAVNFDPKAKPDLSRAQARA